MKSIFYLAERQLDSWRKEGKSRQEIEDLLTSNALKRLEVSAALPIEYRDQVRLAHGNFNRFYQQQFGVGTLMDADLELPDSDISGKAAPEARALAEKQMRWGALELIAKAYEQAPKKDEAFPFQSVKHAIGKMYTLCFPENKLAWDIETSGIKRIGYVRYFDSAKDAEAATSTINDILWIAHGLGDAPKKLIRSTDTPATVRAGENSQADFNELARVEESKRDRELMSRLR